MTPEQFKMGGGGQLLRYRQGGVREDLRKAAGTLQKVPFAQAEAHRENIRNKLRSFCVFDFLFTRSGID